MNDTTTGPSVTTAPPTARPPLRRPQQGQVLAGVCAGIADHVGVDVAIVRLLVVVATFVTGGFGAVVYLVAIFVIPRADDHEERLAVASRRTRQPGIVAARGAGFWVGVGLLVVGVLWLFGGVSPLRAFPGLRPELIWPLVLIGFGLALWKASDRRVEPAAPVVPRRPEQGGRTAPSSRPPTAAPGAPVPASGHPATPGTAPTATAPPSPEGPPVDDAPGPDASQRGQDDPTRRMETPTATRRLVPPEAEPQDVNEGIGVDGGDGPTVPTPGRPDAPAPGATTGAVQASDETWSSGSGPAAGGVAGATPGPAGAIGAAYPAGGPGGPGGPGAAGMLPPPPPGTAGPAGDGAGWTPPPEPQDRSLLTRITLGAALVTVGVLWLLRLGGVDGLGVTRIVAAALLVIGVGLVIGTWFGRGRWLILVGWLLVPLVVLAEVLRPFGVIDVDGVGVRGGVGEIIAAPADLAELETSYQLGAGSIEVDLRQIEFDEPTELTLAVGAGEVIVYLPEHITADVTVRVGVGEHHLDGRESSGVGVPNRNQVIEHGDGSELLTLDASAAFGAVRVEVDTDLGFEEDGTDAGPRDESVEEEGTTWDDTFDADEWDEEGVSEPGRSGDAVPVPSGSASDAEHAELVTRS